MAFFFQLSELGGLFKLLYGLTQRNYLLFLLNDDVFLVALISLK